MILPYFNQYDLNALRVTCKTLRANLPKTSSFLAAYCQRGWEKDKTTAEWHCDHGGTYTKPLYICPGYDDNKPEYATPHSGTFWICTDCLHLDMDNRAASVFHRFRGVQGSENIEPPRVSKYLRICDKCFDALDSSSESGDAVLDMYPKCFCQRDFEMKVKSRSCVQIARLDSSRRSILPTSREGYRDSGMSIGSCRRGMRGFVDSAIRCFQRGGRKFENL